MDYFAIYCCIGMLCFIFFFDVIEEILITNNDFKDNKKDLLTGIFYTICILIWPLLLFSFLEDKLYELEKKE